MKNITLAICLAAAAIGYAESEIVYRDASGRVISKTEVDRNGKTTYRDGMGRIQFTQTVDKSGKITRRDALGRVIWTKTVK